MRALQLGAATGVAAVLIAGGLLGPAFGVPTDSADVSRMALGLADDLDVEWTVAPSTAGINASTEYRVRARNRGGANVASATLTVALPAGFAFDSATPPPPAGFDCLPLPSAGSNGTITCSTTGGFAASAVAELKFVVKPQAVGAAQMTATITGPAAPADPVAGNNTATHSTTVVGPAGGGAVDPGFPDFPYGGFGGGFGDYGYGGYDDDFDDCYSYCY